jgi:dCMP deaminase
MVSKYDQAYMACAEAMAATSVSTRLQVGCVIVVNRSIVAEGINGTPPGFHTNCCEADDGATAWYTIHAEMNALCKAARDGKSVDGGSMYITHLPCPNCVKHVAAAGIKRVYYRHEYRDTSGASALGAMGITLEKI